MAFEPKWVAIHSDNETPNFGAGRRVVYLEGLGHKWARMRSIDGRPQRVRRSAFDQIYREDLPIDKPRPRRAVEASTEPPEEGKE